MRMNNIEATPLMKQACFQAEAALALAVQAVDDLLHEDGAALEHLELVVAFMSVAGAVYTALTIRDGVDAFCEAQSQPVKSEMTYQ